MNGNYLVFVRRDTTLYEDLLDWSIGVVGGSLVGEGRRGAYTFTQDPEPSPVRRPASVYKVTIEPMSDSAPARRRGGSESREKTLPSNRDVQRHLEFAVSTQLTGRVSPPVGLGKY